MTKVKKAKTHYNDVIKDVQNKRTFLFVYLFLYLKHRT